jgi:uncharacterized membrane protein
MTLRQLTLAVIVGLCWPLAGTGAKGRSCEVDLFGMSLRQVILAVIVGVLLAVLVLWLAPELVR